MKEPGVSIDTLTTASSLAYNYGPCVFALIFLFFVCRWTNKIYMESQVREPPASPSDRAVYKYIFLGACSVTALLVVTSIAWFIFIQTRVSAFEFHVTGLNHQQKIWFDSDRFYSRESKRDVPGADVADVYFAIIRHRPMIPGDQFIVKYAETIAGSPASDDKVSEKPAGRPTYSIPVTYTGVNDEVFVVDVDEQGKPILVLRN
jgi:hypothetical protein